MKLNRVTFLGLSLGTLLIQPISAQPPANPQQLYERKVTEASKEDLALAGTYRRYNQKGRIFQGNRITIMVKKFKYRIGEPIRVVHIHEVTEPGKTLYLGPLSVYGEHVDGQPVASESLGDSIAGMAVPTPAVNSNYEITTYSFSQPGIHQIQWRLKTGELESNIISVRVFK